MKNKGHRSKTACKQLLLIFLVVVFHFSIEIVISKRILLKKTNAKKQLAFESSFDY